MIDKLLVSSQTQSSEPSSSSEAPKVVQLPVVQKQKVEEAPKPKEDVMSKFLSGKGKRLDINELFSKSSKNVEEEKPNYKKYGDFKQFTQPQQPNLNKSSSSDRSPQKKLQNSRGPSGNPAEDVQNGYKGRGKNHELAQNLNLDELSEDFDFATNLSLFNKDVRTFLNKIISFFSVRYQSHPFHLTILVKMNDQLQNATSDMMKTLWMIQLVFTAGSNHPINHTMDTIKVMRTE